MSSKEDGQFQALTNATNILTTTTKRVGKIKNLKEEVFNILFSSIFAIYIGYLLYVKYSHSFVGRYIISSLVSIFVIWRVSSYSKGQWEDQIVTGILIIMICLIYRFSWIGINRVLGLELNNPITVGMLSIITFISAIVIISRFTYLNIVKAFSWAIGLSTICLFVFTYSVWGTLKICEKEKTIGGIQDPMTIVIPIYLAWGLMTSFMFVAEMINWSSTKKWLFGISISIGIAVVGYSIKRCSKVKQEMKNVDEKEAEQLAIKNEPSWINFGAHIATILAWFNLFIGHIISSAFFSIIGYCILDQCAPAQDPRILSVNFLSLVYIIVGLFYIGKHFLRS